MKPAMTGRSLADIKADLAALGAQVEPDARLRAYNPPQPGVPVGLVVVDRVADVNGKPDYCIHGFTTCVVCSEMCYLGSGTAPKALSPDIYPICVPCAAEQIPEDIAPTGHVDDHLRADGPH